MKVKRLEINGFKSFGDHGMVEFPDGMCAVVGPNGCGKSNVVDSIRWVLGEQSAKQLRGHAMEDVLFNGAAQRGPSGMAEVSMVFENQGDLTHPQFADLAEIMVTRRLYRSGESEYLINKVPCRLKDIQQLLMDTGLGNRAYAIIEQGRVAAFIEAKPVDRRVWLEEAAGITRYKNQKKVSLSKMKGAQDNLDRLNDIVHEVETQMKRLERQAKKAQRYRELRDKIRGLDLSIASHEYGRIQDQMADVRAESDAVGAQLLLANQRVTGLETDQETLKVRLVAAEQEIGQAAQKRMDTQGRIQKAEAEITLLGRDAENQRRLHGRYAQERETLTQTLAERQKELNRAERLGRQAKERLEQSRQEARTVQEELAARQNEQQSHEALVDDCKQALVDHMTRATRISNRQADLDRLQSDITRRQDALAAREQALRSELSGITESSAQAGQAVERMSHELEQTGRDLADIQHQRQALRESLKTASQAEQEATRRRHQLGAEADAMKLSLSSYKWAGDSVRQVVQAAEDGALPCQLLGVAAEKLSVTPGSEALVEAALGADLQALVVQTGDEAKSLAAWATEQGLGALRVLALDDLQKQGLTAPAQSQALVGLAEPKPGFEPLTALLAGAGWCPDLESAWQSAAGMAPGQLLVDRAGNRLERPGAAQLGAAGEESSILARQNELGALQESLTQAQAALDQATASRRGLEAEQAGLEEKAAGLEAVLKEQESALAQHEKEAFRLSEAAGAKSRELEGLEFDSSEIETEFTRITDERERLAQEEEGLEVVRQELQDDLDRAQRSLAEGRRELEQAREREGDARLALASLENQAQNAAQEAHRLHREASAIQGRIDELGREMAQADQSVESLSARRGQEQERLGKLLIQLDEQEDAHRRARELHNQAQVKAADLDAALKQAWAEQRQVQEASQRLDLKRQQLELTCDNLCGQIMERCRVDLTSDHQAYLPETSFDPETSRERLAKLRQRLNRLGAVNLEAISEHQALAERFEFLTSQRGDLEASLADLQKAIRKINKSSRARFSETFEQVNLRMQEIFPVLFNGGSASLSLDEGVDPLESGLHLMVELPGKKLRNLEALSGGEKALAAVAVMFALFLIRPAPFCILDEVDAPLDEANIGRFHSLLARLGEHSQIVLITHSRRTMEIVERLYGVTMEEKGVSKLLAVNLKRGQSMAA